MPQPEQNQSREPEKEYCSLECLPQNLISQCYKETDTELQKLVVKHNAQRGSNTQRAFQLVAATSRMYRGVEQEVQELAKDIVLNAHDLGPDEIQFEATLQNLQGMNPGNQFENPFEGEAEQEQTELTNGLKNLIDKRRLCNAMLQGGASVMHDLIYTCSDQLDAICPGASVIEKELMERGMIDLVLIPTEVWTQMIEEMGIAPSGGKVQLSFTETGTKAEVQAVCFTLLLHELNKGIYEAAALHGLPADKETRESVIEHADQPQFEPWDIVHGRAIWRRFNKSIKTLEPREKLMAFRKLVSLPATEFMQEVIGLITNPELAPD